MGDGGEGLVEEGAWEKVHHYVEGCAGHYVDEEAGRENVVSTARPYFFETNATYLVTLSRLWKTRLLRHMMMATALLPMTRQ